MKIIVNILLLIVVLVTNPWSWQIFSFNLYLLFLIWISSIFLYLSLLNLSRKLLYAFWLLMILILVVQWNTTIKSTLFYMDPTEQNVFNIRRGKLLVLPINLFGEPVNFDSGRFLENKLTFASYKLEQNFFRSLDPNIYFFGGHPREREGIREFEKLTFLFLPFFIGGLIYLVKHQKWWILMGLLVPLAEISVIGHDNPIGPFSVFPFFITTIAIGMNNTLRDILIKYKLLRR